MKKPSKLSGDQKIEVAKDYVSGLSCGKIAKKYDISPAYARLVVRGAGVKMRTPGQGRRVYSLDESFFERIDTEEKAYFLGFLYGDGCVCRQHCGIYILGLQSDEQVFMDLSKIIKSNCPLKRVTRKGKSKIYTIFRFYSLKMKNDLHKLGVTPNKTKTIEYPHNHIPKHLAHHFIRGLFDSDGCVTCSEDSRGTSKRYTANWNIHSTKSMLLSIKAIMANSEVFTNELSHDKRCYENSAILSTSKVENLYKIREYLYKDSTICLERKKSRFDEILLLKPREGLRSQNLNKNSAVILTAK